MNRYLLTAVLAAALHAAVVPPASARGPWHASERNTPGWRHMSPHERVEHQRRMRGFARYGECADYETARQRRLGGSGPGAGDLRGCDELLGQGRVK